MIWLAHFSAVVLLLMWLKNVCCVCARDVGMISKIIDDHQMERMPECRVRLGYCGRSFLSPAIYKSASANRNKISRSVFRSSSHFCNTSTNTVNLTRLPSWIYCYRSCIISGVQPQCGQRLVVACICRCGIFMVWKVLLMHFLMKYDIWMVVVSRARLNNVRSTSSHSAVWFRFRLSHYWGIQGLYIL